VRRALLPLPLLLIAFPAFAGDKDKDGLKGKADTCPEEPETRNGWKDADGCPDELGAVEVLVLNLDGQPVRGATVRLGSERGLSADDGRIRFADRTPETVVTLRVEASGFQPVDLVDFEIPEGEHSEVVMLDWEAVSVQVLVIDAATREPLDAAVRWDGPGHIETGRTEADGEAEFPARPGSWRLRAEADHYGGADRTVEVDRDGVEPVHFSLVPNWMRIEERWIEFAAGSADLTDDARHALDAMAGDLFGFPDVAVTVEGHADAPDDTLARRRAEVVAAALYASGVDRGRVEVRDLGDAVPFDTPWTPAGRAANRAVRFRFVDEGEGADPTLTLSIPFEEDAADPPADLAARLAPLASALRGRPNSRVEVEGHRDRGEGALSARRAAAVREYLLSRGVEDVRLFAVGRRAVDGLDGGVGFRLRSGAEVADLPHEVYFERGGALVEAMSVDVLREAAELLVKHPVMRVAVRGHAQARDAVAASALARQRADEVVEFLRTRGVAADRIQVRGYGEEGDESDVRARRVDFVVVPPPLLSTERIPFEPSSGELGEMADPVLRRVADALSAHPAVKLQVVGSAREGEGGSVDVVGRGRAAAVRDALVRRGVDATRLSVAPQGELASGELGEVRFRIASVSVAEGLRFGPRSADLDAEARAQLDRIVPTLQLTDGPVRVTGFAGASDGRAVLAELATQRADAVVAYLTYAGIAPTRLRSAGEVDPEPGAAGRRVEVRSGR
jgi:outer membrane protein OmpA-like peptidoglycan-associated protein